MHLSPLIDRLIDALQILPGVGPKSAQRMALHVLRNNRDGGERLAVALTEAVTQVGYCQRCRSFTEHSICDICADERRDRATICVVESPADILAIEHTASYRGRYFVLHGRLSPIDGIGPEDLAIDRLLELVAEGVDEVILATNPTVEGEATAHYISESLAAHLGAGSAQVSRIAHGVPIGGELEYVDSTTIVHAFKGRRRVSELE
jgi:recombination protein RecR